VSDADSRQPRRAPLSDDLYGGGSKLPPFTPEAAKPPEALDGHYPDRGWGSDLKKEGVPIRELVGDLTPG
jgi:hypothetical protein